MIQWAAAAKICLVLRGTLNSSRIDHISRQLALIMASKIGPCREQNSISYSKLDSN